jgi:hypothetical protein
VFVNYLGAVKLYSQTERSDGGFLDAFVRRRASLSVAE